MTTAVLYPQNIQRIMMLWSKVISSLEKINSINLRTFSTVHTNSEVGVDKYTRLPHEVFLLIRWVFTKGNKVLREDYEPSVKFHNFLPMKHLFKMLTLRNIGQASANDRLMKMKATIPSAQLTPIKVRFLTKKYLCQFFHCSE